MSEQFSPADPSSGVGARVAYKVAGEAMRQSLSRANRADLTLATRRVLDQVLAETVTYSKLTAQVKQPALAKSAGVNVRTVRRALRKLCEEGVIVFVPGQGAGNLTIVGVPPKGMKADDYLSALGLPPLSAFEAPKEDKASSAKKRTPTRARVDRELDLGGEQRLSEEETVGLEPSGLELDQVVGDRTVRSALGDVEALLAPLDEVRQDSATSADDAFERSQFGSPVQSATAVVDIRPEPMDKDAESLLDAEIDSLLDEGVLVAYDPTAPLHCYPAHSAPREAGP